MIGHVEAQATEGRPGTRPPPAHDRARGPRPPAPGRARARRDDDRPADDRPDDPPRRRPRRRPHHRRGAPAPRSHAVPANPVTTTPSLAPLPPPLALPTQAVPSGAFPPSSEGYVFPVYGQVSFTDRRRGATDVDWHHGNDIFAPEGRRSWRSPTARCPRSASTPSAATACGSPTGGATASTMRTSRLRAVLRGRGQVQAGQVVGFVGHTGYAETSRPTWTSRVPRATATASTPTRT